MAKHPIALRLVQQICKNDLLLHSSCTFSLECSVFLIQSLDVCFKDEANKKDQMQNSTQGSAGNAMRALSMT